MRCGMRNERDLVLVLILALALGPKAQGGWVKDAQGIMGTTVRAEVWHRDEAVARAGAAAVMEEMRRIDGLMSPYRAHSELARVNAQASRRAVAVGPELLDVVQRARRFSELTHGAFDITFASVGHLYDYRNGRRPDAQTIESLLPAISYRHIHVDARAGLIAFDRPGVRIDLGGIAKGYAVDRALERLRRLGICHALVSAGGDTGILGDRLGRPWMVGIRDPRHLDVVVAMLPLQDEALSTSGDYERYFEEDGVRYHHIIDPGTGGSAGALTSVSVLGPDATTTDALSTSLFVMGVRKGMALVDSLDGIEAIMVDRSGELYFSDGLASVDRESTAR